MNDNQRGLYSKYQVTKNGNPLDGDCFVLRPDRDPAAVAALRTYAEATPNKALARDIIGWIGEPEPLTPEQLREMDYEPVWVVDIGRVRYGNQWCVFDGDDAYVPGVEQWWYSADNYGETWLAYAYRPQEGSK